MKKFLAIYTGTPSGREKWNALDEATRTQRQQAGMKAWSDWANSNKAVIVDAGGPLGKTKRATTSGIADIANSMAAYTIVSAESHEAAVKMFANHPHFEIFPGDGVEVMECLAIPTQ